MDAQRLNLLIDKMIQPNASVSSLTMCAERLGKDSQEDLYAFFSALCDLDISKAAAVSLRLSNTESREATKKIIRHILFYRCYSHHQFTPQDLLAIAAVQDPSLLQEIAPSLIDRLVGDTFRLADDVSACRLMEMGLVSLPEEPRVLFRKAFCAFLGKYTTRMDKALAELLPSLLEYDDTITLSLLIETAGAKKVESLYGKDLFPEVQRLILSDKGTVPLWEIYFEKLFSRELSQEELLLQGLWFLQMYTDDTTVDAAAAVFYLHVATRYGVDHPLFECVTMFEPPERYSASHTLRYKDAFCGLWNQPEALSRFLDQTIICNPYRVKLVQETRYDLFQRKQDPTAYDRLTALFEDHAPIGDILKIFFSTDLRQKLPLEDLFGLANLHGVLPELLDCCKDVPFPGLVTRQRTQVLVVSPQSYFVTGLHTIDIDYQVFEDAGSAPLKGKTLRYTISGYTGNHICISLYKDEETEEEESLSWEDSVKELANLLEKPIPSPKALLSLSIYDYSLEDFGEANDFDMLTQLMLEKPEDMPRFFDIIKECKWNAPFLQTDLKAPGGIYAQLTPYREKAAALFNALFRSDRETAFVLDFYFSTIYKAILPLNELLLMADRELLLQLLPKYELYCRFRDAQTPLCRLQNINCTPICSVEEGSNISREQTFFTAVISDFTIREDYVYRIALRPCQAGELSVEERGSLFGYIARNDRITRNRSELFARCPKTEDCIDNEIIFNLNCMVKAILLRRSDGIALAHLLEGMGRANPFFFQDSFRADQLYLEYFRKRKKEKSTIPDAAVSMILEAKNIRQIQDFYLHTNIKFFLRLPDLAEILQKRRQDLVSQIPSLFRDTEFYAVADRKGSLWLPWVAQDTLRVPEEYAGKFLHCRLVLDRDGNIDVTVLNAYKSSKTQLLLKTCLMAGYNATPDIDGLLTAPEDPNATVE